VRADSPIRDLADLIAKAKASPGKYTYGSGGVGTGNHLGAELLKRTAGLDLLHVPFRGISLAIGALYAGDIDLVVTNALETLAHVRDGRMRALGVGGAARMPELPDVPAIGEQVPGYVMTNWYGCSRRAACRRASCEIAVRAACRAQRRRPQAARGGCQHHHAGDADDALRARMESEVPRWKQIIPELGLKVE